MFREQGKKKKRRKNRNRDGKRRRESENKMNRGYSVPQGRAPNTVSHMT